MGPSNIFVDCSQEPTGDFVAKIIACEPSNPKVDVSAFAGTQSGNGPLIVGNTNTPVSTQGGIVLPDQCNWTIGGITNGTDPMLEINPGFSIYGDSVQNNCVFHNNSSNAYAGLWQRPVTGQPGGNYYTYGGFQIANSNSPTPQPFASGVECLFNSGQDGSLVHNVLCADTLRPPNAETVIRFAATGGSVRTCCGAAQEQLNGNGNSVSKNVWEDIADQTNGGMHGVFRYSSSITHPGPGFYNYLCQDTQNTPSSNYAFINLYQELTFPVTGVNSGLGDTTTDVNYIDGCASVVFAGLTNVAAGTANSTKKIFHISNRANSGVLIQDLVPGNGGVGTFNFPFNCIVNDFTGDSVPCPSVFTPVSYSSIATYFETLTVFNGLTLPETTGSLAVGGITQGGCGTNAACFGPSGSNLVQINNIGGIGATGTIKAIQFGVNGSTSGSANLTATNTGGTLNINSTNFQVDTSGNQTLGAATTLTANGNVYIPAAGSTNLAVGGTNGACGTNLACFGLVQIDSASDIGVPGHVKAALYQTISNCSSAAVSPAVCGSAPTGSVSIPAGTNTVTVNTTAVDSNSLIQLTFDSSFNTKNGVTCNTTPQQATVTARSSGASFTITVPSNFSVNPGCISYDIKN